ncbi:DNA primase [Psychrobacillus phage Perkons]|nr:DNA primase [Psychrobacillus phage Perkons]
MNVHSLKNYIINNSELIKRILEKAGFHYISDKFSGGLEYRCAWDEDGSHTGIRIYKETLSTTYFKTGLHGDLITLVKEKKNLSFPQTLEYISKIVEFKDEDEVEYDLAFSGLFLKIQRLADDGELCDLKTYSDSVLDNYLIMPSEKFIEDGINYKVQQDFLIGHCNLTDRIVVPWRNLKGEIIGIMGRLNKDELEPHENKWYPIIKFSKSRALFGFSENYQHIQTDNMVMIFESEKSVLKCASNDINCALALGGSSLSDYQADNINSLFPKTIIIALDEGLSSDVSHNMAVKLKLNTYFKNNVGYIYDSTNAILPKGSKLSPADLPVNEMKKLIADCTIWV